MSKPIAVAWRESAADLYARYRDARDVEARKRLGALWLVRRGLGVAEASEAVGIGQRTLERWLAWYREAGLAAVLARVPGHGATGAACRLSAAQRRELVARSGRGQFRTYDDARAWVRATWGVAYRYQGMYALLARLGVHPKVPRPVAAKADAAAQARWTRGGSPRPS